ncbi:OTU domain [Cinara cedri]|uniref:OTU domain n=1 Tax=Cinara cedri TaxID=506608 RepID=A0A5E4NJE1_9HEMI|nr:OTU domain [Cinara cedri]
MTPHIIIPIIGDGACLFRAMSFVLYDTQDKAQEVREKIVTYVMNHWEDYSIMSHDSDGNNYRSSADYFTDMLQFNTYGGLCELVAAGQLYLVFIEVYLNGELYEKFGSEGNPVKRLRFSSMQNLSNGHFDVYLLYEDELTTSISKKQKNPVVHREVVRRYEQINPGGRSKRRIFPWKTKAFSGMKIESEKAYEIDKTVYLGTMSHKCAYCGALKFKEEASKMCFSAGKVQLQPFLPLPEPLYSLNMRFHFDQKHFMDRIRKYNCFQMTSFGMKKIIEDGFLPIFKVKGQVYHLISNLQALPQ